MGHLLGTLIKCLFIILQLYELDDDEKRKEFLDDLFSFMQKRGEWCLCSRVRVCVQIAGVKSAHPSHYVSLGFHHKNVHGVIIGMCELARSILVINVPGQIVNRNLGHIW